MIENDLPRRKRTRLQDFDYSRSGAYFITICTERRRKILSRIVGVDVLGDPSRDLMDYAKTELFQHGIIADKYINQLNEFYENIKVDRYVIMPNHIHLILFVFDNGSPRTSTPTKQTSAVSYFVSTFKRFCNKKYGYNIWQRGFYDHIIRNREDYEKHIKYICENPIRWRFDELYSEE